MRDRIDEYFEWLFDIVCDNRFAKSISYRKLMEKLHQTDFYHILERDAERASDGIDLRYRFDHRYGEQHYYRPCSVLEMMIALAMRWEESFMDDPDLGDRTSQWFWDMVNNLGLGGMTDRNYDDSYIDMVLERFLNRDYAPNGRGGLFTINNRGDLRDVEIWWQMSWYLSTFV